MSSGASTPRMRTALDTSTAAAAAFPATSPTLAMSTTPPMRARVVTARRLRRDVERLARRAATSTRRAGEDAPREEARARTAARGPATAPGTIAADVVILACACFCREPLKSGMAGPRLAKKSNRAQNKAETRGSRCSLVQLASAHVDVGAPAERNRWSALELFYRDRPGLFRSIFRVGAPESGNNIRGARTFVGSTTTVSFPVLDALPGVHHRRPRVTAE